MEPIRVHQSKARIEATEFDLEESRFTKGSMTINGISVAELLAKR